MSQNKHCKKTICLPLLSCLLHQNCYIFYNENILNEVIYELHIYVGIQGIYCIVVLKLLNCSIKNATYICRTSLGLKLFKILIVC